MPVGSSSCFRLNNDPSVHLQTVCSCPCLEREPSAICPRPWKTQSHSWSQNGRGLPLSSNAGNHRLRPHRFGPDHLIDPVKDYTKLTLDAIALATMSYRMNSFYTVSRTILSHPSVLSSLQEDMVPFVAALSRALVECQSRATRPSIVTAMMTATRAQFEADIKLMTDTVLAGTFFNLSVGQRYSPRPTSCSTAQGKPNRPRCASGPPRSNAYRGRY